MVRNRIGHTLFVTLPPDCDAEVLADIGRHVSADVHAHHDRRVVVDVAALDMIDDADADELANLCRTFDLLGARPVIAGLRPEVAAALIGLGVDLGGIECVLDVAAAVDRS